MRNSRTIALVTLIACSAPSLAAQDTPTERTAARDVILQREVQAGKTDGYSNPQIRVGAAIKTRLARLQAAIP